MSEHEHVHEHGHEHPHVHGHVHDPEQTKKISNRLARAIGHLESIKKMVEDDRDCSEVLIQLAAVKKRPAEYQPDVFYWNVLPFA